jgi:hypothetical protein
MTNIGGGFQLKRNSDDYHKQSYIQGQIIVDVCRRAKGGKKRSNHLLRKKDFLGTFIQKRDIS